MSEKTAIITGGNSGIGFQTARELTRLGWRVIITGRDESKLRAAADAIGGVVWRKGDFASFRDVRALAQVLDAEPRIDVLVNNIGISLSRQQKTEDGNDMMLQVNHLAPFLLTGLLLDRLKASAPARIVNVASRAHVWANGPGFDDFQFARNYSTRAAYARTKLYNILFTRELARRLAGSGVTANALHPGMIRTKIGHDGDLTGLASIVWPLLQRWRGEPVEAGARVTMHVATAPELDGVSGNYYSTDLRETAPSALAQDDRAAALLWTMSEELVRDVGPAPR
jgi:NAD(P)-dependent dehydrogenase (short-subunit alcohol dehydrogenase family)